MRGKTIVVVGGYWSTNIGNSFFQLGAEYMLKQAVPDGRVVMLSDQPGYYNVRRGNPAQALDYLAHIQIDYLVILGPYLRPEYPRIWYETLTRVAKRGVKVMVISAGMMQYSTAAFRSARSWLSHIRPFVFMTRDRETFENLADLADHSYDGVDVATFVSDLFPPVPTDLPPYFVFNFDQIPEPRITLVEGPTQGLRGEYAVLSGVTLRFHFPRLETALSRRSKAFPFARSLLPPHGERPNEIAGRMIIRTDHRFNPMLIRKSYAYPNSFVSDVPYTYLNLYASTDATFSNRVHACVATLAYGKPARLFSDTPRAYLLDRLQATGIQSELTSIDQAQLAEEKLGMIHFLRSTLQQDT